MGPRLLAALSLVVLVACSEDETTPVDIGPTGQPSIVLVRPSDGECVSVGTNPDARVPIQLDTEELVLRPPGACGQFVQCGHLALYADGVLNNESSVRTIELLLRKLGDRYHDGKPHAGTGAPDVLEVRIEVVDDAGTVKLDHDGSELRSQLSLITVPDCSGAGGAGGTGGTGGAGGSGGAGGAAGSGGAGGAGGQ